MKAAKYTRKGFALLLAVQLLTPMYGTVYGDELSDRLESVQQQMAEQEQKKNDAELIIGSVSATLERIQKELEAAEAELERIENEQRDTERKIAENEQKLKEAQARLERREGILRKRIRDIYINGKLSYLDVVLGAKDFNDFSTRVQLLRRIINSDMELIKAVKEERAQIEIQKAELERDYQRILQLKDEAIKQQAAVEEKKAEQMAVLHKAQTDKAVAEAAYAELEAASNEIAEMLRAREAARASSSGPTQAVSGTGQFMWPVDGGVITSPFGYRMHPIFGRMIGHTGIDIGVDYGSNIYAADSGVVTNAGWISGYGYTVIIDHGNGYATLYGHNQDLAVSEGQSVSRGQVIAYAGSTGNSTGPHCHFEIRYNGEPQDPMGYV